MQIKGADVAAFAARPKLRHVLVFGPDNGQASELATAIAKALADETTTQSMDGLKYADIAAVALAGPSLFGTTRTLKLRGATDKSTKLLKEVLIDPELMGPIVIEAGDLPSSSSLRKLFVDAKNLIAIACYEPDVKQRLAIATGMVREADLTIDAEATMLLQDLLPSGSLAVRQEIEKLITYAGNTTNITRDTIAECLSDGLEVTTDMLTDAITLGDPRLLVRRLRAIEPGTAAVGLLRQIQRHFIRLLDAKTRVDAGASVDGAMAALRPPVFYKQQGTFSQALRKWPVPRIERAIGHLTEAEIKAKSNGYPDMTIARQTLIELAIDASAR